MNLQNFMNLFSAVWIWISTTNNHQAYAPIKVSSLHPFSVAYPYRSSSTFGPGSGPIFLTHLNCLGTERTLLDCSSSYRYTYYYSHYRDAGVRCEHRRYQYSGELHYTSRNYCQLVILWLASKTCALFQYMYIVSGRSRGGSMDSMELALFWRAAFENGMWKCAVWAQTVLRWSSAIQP